MNFLSTTGKINNLTAAAVSDANPTLFTPKGYTFSIWGIIYLLLFIYVLVQLFSAELGKDERQSKIAFWFIVSSAFNVGWIFAWQYGQFLVSVLVMAVLLFSLTRILSLVAGTEHTLTNLFSLELPFGLYAGWITLAIIPNIAVLLLSIGWDGFGIAWFIWLIIVLLLATAIAISATRSTRNVAYPAAILWGLTGILVRYLPDFSFDLGSETMWIVVAMVLSMLAVAIRWIDVIIRRLR
ncbi:MAG: tryptophan-rich sensory protein [Firmicutes bacterium]|nr:tryptophan-rich sensory protein [Bacillota bacterium]